MKFNRIILLCSFILVTMITINTPSNIHYKKPFPRPSKSDTEQFLKNKSSILTTTKLTKKKEPSKGVSDFLKLMGKIEGLGSYQTVSKSGYLGLYQFHPRTLKILGVNVDKSAFLNNPKLQDSVMIVWMKDNARSLKGLISRHDGTYYNGVYITKAGILAGAHLVGPGGVLSFFYPDRYKFKTVDGNGVPVQDYMIKFANYNLRGI